MRLRPWLFLLAAIAAEVAGVTVMKLVSDSGSAAAFIFMYAMIGLSFYFLAIAVKDLPMALTYATWETLGLTCIAFIGFRFFGESLGLYKLLGMAVLMAGVVMVNLGAPRTSEN
ncbi:ligand-binding protein SH3 [Thauera sinica]|nr:ligand-binding protein SH3 [Thauera sp. K11]